MLFFYFFYFLPQILWKGKHFGAYLANVISAAVANNIFMLVEFNQIENLNASRIMLPYPFVKLTVWYKG